MKNARNDNGDELDIMAMINLTNIFYCKRVIWKGKYD